MDTVSNDGLLQPLLRSVLRVRSGGIWKGASFQVRPTHVRMRFASVVTGHGIAVACALAAKDRDLHSVQFLSDAGRTHQVAEHVQTLAQVLQATEHHITNRDMSPDPLWGPVIDGPDLEFMLVGAEAGFDFPQLVISGDNIQNVQIVCTMDQNSMKAVPLGCVLDPGLVNRNIASVEERRETTIPTSAEARKLAAALEFFCSFSIALSRLCASFRVRVGE